MESVSQTLTEALLSTTESFSAVTRARNKSHTTPNTGCVTILYKWEISESNPHRRTFEHHRAFLGSYENSRSNPHRRTSEHHRVFLDSDSCAQ